MTSASAASASASAGRGGLAIAVAKISFILFGFAQQIILERLLGKDGYGEVSRVLVVVGIVNNVVVAASIQGVSRAVSTTTQGQEAETFARALRIHLVIAAILSIAFALAAGSIASSNRPRASAICAIVASAYARTGGCPRRRSLAARASRAADAGSPASRWIIAR